MKKKKMKIWKKILITLLVIIIALAATAYCVFNFYIKPKYSDKLMNAISLIMEDDELASEINEVLEDEQLKQDIEAAVSDEQLQADISEAVNEAIQSGGGQENTPAPTSQPEAGKPKAEEKQPEEKKEQSAPTKKPSTKGKSKMEIAKENVAPQDFAAGMRMAGKIDIGYLTGLSKGGFTAEEKAAAKAHLKSRLSGAEISKLKSLIAKYSYLLN